MHQTPTPGRRLRLGTAAAVMTAALLHGTSAQAADPLGMLARVAHLQTELSEEAADLSRLADKQRAALQEGKASARMGDEMVERLRAHEQHLGELGGQLSELRAELEEACR